MLSVASDCHVNFYVPFPWHHLATEPLYLCLTLLFFLLYERLPYLLTNLLTFRFDSFGTSLDSCSGGFSPQSHGDSLPTLYALAYATVSSPLRDHKLGGGRRVHQSEVKQTLQVGAPRTQSNSLLLVCL